jgi:hypothetical protein
MPDSLITYDMSGAEEFLPDNYHMMECWAETSDKRVVDLYIEKLYPALLRAVAKQRKEWRDGKDEC